MTAWRVLGIIGGMWVSSAIAAPVEINGGYKFATIADVTVTGSATLVDAADGNRLALNCTNTSASVNVRWGPSTVTAAAGQRLPAGTSITIQNVGAVYMISEGANVTVSCTKETY